MGFDLVDLVILAATLIGLANGYRRGFWLSAAQYAGLVVGVLLGATAADLRQRLAPGAELVALAGDVTDATHRRASRFAAASCVPVYTRLPIRSPGPCCRWSRCS